MPKAIVVLVKFLDDADGWGVGSVVVNGRGAEMDAEMELDSGVEVDVENDVELVNEAIVGGVVEGDEMGVAEVEGTIDSDIE